MFRYKRGFAVLMTVILLALAAVGVSAEAMAGGGNSIGGGASAGAAGGASGAMNGDGAYAGNYSAGNEIAGNGAVGEGYNGNNATNRGGANGSRGSSIVDDMVTGAQDAAGIGDSTGNAGNAKTPRGVVSDTAAGDAMADDGGSGFVGIVVTVIIAIAVVLLIIALMPKKRVE